MAFKMKYKKGGFPFKNDDDEKKVVSNEESENEEFVNDGSVQPGVTRGLHNALTKDLEENQYPPHYTEEDIKFLKEQNEDIVREEDKIKK